MANDRDCENCIHKVNGACNVWECKFEPKSEIYRPCSKCHNEECVFMGRSDTHSLCEDFKPKFGTWIPVSERLPELNRPLLVTAYHRVYYGHLISENGNYGYPVFRIHGLGDKNRDWVQETMSHGPYSLGRIDAWMYLDIPEPYKPQEGGDQE